MSTLTPIGGRGRGRRSALPAIAVGIVALLLGGAAGWYLTRDDAPTTTTPGPTTSSCPSPTGSGAAKPKALPKPSAITVDVYNATDTQGLAKKTAGQLEERGFVIGDIDNDPENKAIKVSAEVRYGKKGKPSAVVVAAQFPESKLVNDKRSDKTVSVAIGDGFTVLATPEQVAVALSPSPSTTC